ncbi:hypothetical protein QPK32_07580 [Massilia sp. YIM B02763]|uniref:hypothetical protein n=1 Tax=Massilia sp. YIM B02763 TaxID=3050130 RepID=UPI0025B70E72|nr:hypothetical protein [Massilia sp. YIM B02763]MDN4052934.1 hypothetical protein [Massilia sp. YIM B02763]
MDANQRSSINNQTNNGANEKWTPGSEGNTADKGQPLDHTYPQGLGVDQGNQQRDIMGNQGRTGADIVGGNYDRSHGDDGTTIPGGSMETQINGGSGAVQGITDSHQRQMEQKSGAYGVLQQPLSAGDPNKGYDLKRERDMGRDAVRGQMASQNPAQPDLRAGNMQASTQGGGMPGPRSSFPSDPAGSMGNRQSVDRPRRFVSDGGGMPGPASRPGNASGNGDVGGQEAQRGNTQLDVTGSRSMANQHSDIGGVHESNDVAGGLPRSPGNAGASSVDRPGSQTGPGGAEGGPPAHESNDAAGGYPRSPGYANKLRGDQNMDDDTGFKRKP